jgi:hypothetical protein
MPNFKQPDLIYLSSIQSLLLPQIAPYLGTKQMKLFCKSRSLLLATLALATGSMFFQSTSAHAVNLIKNGNFTQVNSPQDTPFSWNSSNATVKKIGNASMNSNVNVAEITAGGYLSQGFKTSASTDYRVSFESYKLGSRNLNDYTVEIDNMFKFNDDAVGIVRLAQFNLNSLQSIARNDLFDNFSFSFNIGTFLPDRTILTFRNNSQSDNFTLTNVNVDLDLTKPPTSVPEPLSIIGTSIAGIAAFRMRKKLRLAA